LAARATRHVTLRAVAVQGGWQDSKHRHVTAHELRGGTHAGGQRLRSVGSEQVASESSFDVVSKVDKQEVDNALNQAAKEVGQRYDFRGTGAGIAWSGEKIIMRANSEDRVKAVLDVFQTKLVRRGVSLKAIDAGDPTPSGKEHRIEAGLKEGLSQENAKKISKLIRDEGPKGVKAQVTGDELRVSAKSRDDLQAVIRLLKDVDVDAALQFVNYR
jgi:uncharacterized protein YajQ (UPF0234 family)